MRRPLAATAVAVSLLSARPVAAIDDVWFVSFNPATVTPVPRSDTQRLFEGGVVQTDGFSHMTFSFAGEFKEGVPESGRIGVILVPDDPKILHLLRNEGQIVFGLEVKFKVAPGQSAIFVSEQQTERVAFPRYRVFYYNETSSSATVSLSVYRSRC